MINSRKKILFIRSVPKKGVPYGSKFELFGLDTVLRECVSFKVEDDGSHPALRLGLDCGYYLATGGQDAEFSEYYI